MSAAPLPTLAGGQGHVPLAPSVRVATAVKACQALWEKVRQLPAAATPPLAQPCSCKSQGTLISVTRHSKPQAPLLAPLLLSLVGHPYRRAVGHKAQAGGEQQGGGKLLSGGRERGGPPPSARARRRGRSTRSHSRRCGSHTPRSCRRSRSQPCWSTGWSRPPGR